MNCRPPPPPPAATPAASNCPPTPARTCPASPQVVWSDRVWRRDDLVGRKRVRRAPAACCQATSPPRAAPSTHLPQHTQTTHLAPCQVYKAHVDLFQAYPDYRLHTEEVLARDNANSVAVHWTATGGWAAGALAARGWGRGQHARCTAAGGTAVYECHYCLPRQQRRGSTRCRPRTNAAVAACLPSRCVQPPMQASGTATPPRAGAARFRVGVGGGLGVASRLACTPQTCACACACRLACPLRSPCNPALVRCPAAPLRLCQASAC